MKAKYEKILNAEISNHKLTSNLANATLLTANMRKLKSAYNSLQNESQNTDPFQAFCYKWIVPLTVILQIGILLVNTTNQSLEKVVGAKAISKYVDKQEKAKMITFVTQMVTGIMTIANVAIEAFCPYL